MWEVEHLFILYMFHKCSLLHNTFSVNPYKHLIYDLSTQNLIYL